MNARQTRLLSLLYRALWSLSASVMASERMSRTICHRAVLCRRRRFRFKDRPADLVADSFLQRISSFRKIIVPLCFWLLFHSVPVLSGKPQQSKHRECSLLPQNLRFQPAAGRRFFACWELPKPLFLLRQYNAGKDGVSPPNENFFFFSFFFFFFFFFEIYLIFLGGGGGYNTGQPGRREKMGRDTS